MFQPFHDGEPAGNRIQEDHVMRLMFVQEMALAMNSAGLEVVGHCPFLDLAGELSTDSWNVTFVGVRSEALGVRCEGLGVRREG